MKDRVSHSNHEFIIINLIEVEDRIDVIMIREDTKEGLGPTIHTEDV